MGSDSGRGPMVPSTWRRPSTRGRGFVINHPQETRHVTDRTLGGDVVFIRGNCNRPDRELTCTLAEWNEWVSGGGVAPKAKRVSP
jgi:hypothetical protein